MEVYRGGGKIFDCAVDGADADKGGGTVEGEEDSVEVLGEETGALAVSVEMNGKEDETA